MYFDSLSEFFLMGGHALYVWSSVLVTFLVLAANLLLPWLKLRAVTRQLQRNLRRQQAAE